MPRNGTAGELLFILMLVAGSGCGGPDRPVKVEGVVTLDDNPLPGATVTFVPIEEGRRPASGLSDASGVFELTTFNSGDGALPGQYKVTVTVGTGDPLPQAAQAKDLGEGNEPGAMKARYAASKTRSARKAAAARAASSPVPAVYRDSKSTPLTQTVPANGKVRVELHSKSR